MFDYLLNLKPKPVLNTILRCGLSFFLLNTALPSLSQSNAFQKGFYVKHSGDTLNGYLNLDENAGYVEFRNDKKSNVQNIPVDSIKNISVNKEVYLPWSGRRSLIYVDKFTYEIMFPDSFKLETINLKQIYRGTSYALYYFKDKREHFFLEANNKIEELLISYRYLTDFEKMTWPDFNTPYYFTTPIYKSQLTALIGAKPNRKQKAQIEAITYESKSLVRFLKSL